MSDALKFCIEPRPRVVTESPTTHTSLNMSTSKDVAEGAIVFNRASLALAKSQRLIASWLPPKISEEAIETRTEEELDREESEAFLPVPELYGSLEALLRPMRLLMSLRLGLGARVPSDGERQLGHRSSNVEDRLRRQLMGKHPRVRSHSHPHPNPNGSFRTKYKLHDKSTQSDSDDEAGRTAIRGRNTAAPINRAQPGSLISANTQGTPGIHARKAMHKTPHAAASRKRSTSYLDEVLMERPQKRKKKRKVENRQNLVLSKGKEC